MRTVADDIRKYLKKADRTPTWFAKKSGLSQATISRILSGEQRNLTDETKRSIYNVIDGKYKMEEEMDKQFIAGLMKQISDLTQMVKDLQHENTRLNSRLQERRSSLMENEDVSLSRANGTTNAPDET